MAACSGMSGGETRSPSPSPSGRGNRTGKGPEGSGDRTGADTSSDRSWRSPPVPLAREGGCGKVTLRRARPITLRSCEAVGELGAARRVSRRARTVAWATEPASGKDGPEGRTVRWQYR